MSTNFHIKATRQIQIVKTGSIEEQVDYIDVWQTSSNETEKIFQHQNPLEGYKNYLRQFDEKFGPVIEDIYAEDDLLCERGPITSIERFRGNEEITRLEEKMKMMKIEGWEFSYEAW